MPPSSSDEFTYFDCENKDEPRFTDRHACVSKQDQNPSTSLNLLKPFEDKYGPQQYELLEVHK